MPGVLPFPELDVIVDKPGSLKGLAHWYGITHPGEEKFTKYNRVTTILDKTIPKPGLLVWSRRVALNHVAAAVDATKGAVNRSKILAMLKDADVEPDRVKDEAADWGTRAHEAIQMYMESKIFDKPEPKYGKGLKKVVAAFKKFERGKGLVWMATELTVWMPNWQVAGTVDAVAMDKDGNWWIFDWKTSNGFYYEQALQLGAYAEGFEHLTGIAPKGAGIVRFPKEEDPNGAWFEVKMVADIDAQRKQYGALVDLFHWLRIKPWEVE